MIFLMHMLLLSCKTYQKLEMISFKGIEDDLSHFFWRSENFHSAHLMESFHLGFACLMVRKSLRKSDAPNADWSSDVSW